MSSIGDCGDSTNELLYLAVVEVPKRFPANDFQGNINAREEGAVSTGITFMRHSYHRDNAMLVGFSFLQCCLQFYFVYFIYFSIFLSLCGWG